MILSWVLNENIDQKLRKRRKGDFSVILMITVMRIVFDHIKKDNSKEIAKFVGLNVAFVPYN